MPFVKMAKVGCPRQAVINKLSMAGFDGYALIDAVMFAAGKGPAPAAPRGPPQFTRPPTVPAHAQHPGPPPRRPSMNQPPPPSPAAIPDYLIPFVKMAKVGVPRAAVRNKLIQGGIDGDAMVDLVMYSAGKGPPPSAAPQQQQPQHRAPRQQASSGRSALLAGIRGGKALKKRRVSAEKPKKLTGRAALMAGIKGAGRGLKKLKKRKALAPKPVSARENMLSMIRSGANLRRAKTVQKVVEKEKNDTILALMQRRAAMEDSSDSDSDSEWSDD